MDKELKPCPFCGGNKLMPITDQVDRMIGRDGDLLCLSCGAKAGTKKWSIRTAPEWISIDERLPEEDFQVLVCSDDDVFISTMRGGFVQGDYWFDCERDKGLKVHYWMPLPEPPKE